MFWKFDLHPSTAIDSILSKEDCTLCEILDEDDVLQETKSQNRKLIDFFVRPEILEELVTLIIKEPEEDFDEKLRYKHPNTACEVLTADVFTIIDKLTSNEDLLNKLWVFLDREPPLNPLLASFFSKVMGVLITRKTSQMMDFLKSKEDFVGQIIKHMGTSAIMDLLLRLITSVESPQLRQDLLEWLNEQKLIEGLVSLVDPEIDEERNSNAAQTLNDIIRLSRDHMTQLQESACEDPLLDAIQRRDTISNLLDHMFHGIHNHNDSAMVNGIMVLLTLLEVRKGMGEGEEPMTALDTERLAQGVCATLAAITPRLKDFHDLLRDPPLMQPMKTTIGTLDPPLGNARLQIAKLISSVLATNSDTINKELASIGTMTVLWDLFFKYSWNNFLHTQVEQCISIILNNPPTEEDGEMRTPLVDSLFKDSHVLQKIVESWEEDPEIESQARHRGYMGHLTNIANHVVYARGKGKNKDIIETVFNDLPEKEREKWNTFVTGTLADINKTNTTDLVGHHPLQSSSDDDEEYKPVPFLHSEGSLQQVFSNYQMQQMTADFMDTFGLDGDDFQEPDQAITAPFDKIGDLNFAINANEDNPNSALFEACCNERIQQFDDSGSDEEDVWEEKELTFSSVLENRKSTLSDSDSESSGSDDEEERASPGHHSISSSSSDDDNRIVFSDGDNTPQSSPVKQAPPALHKEPALENKMDVDSNAWDSFVPGEVAMDDVVAMDASDVGWDNSENTPAPTEADTGWANFDSFTDIRMAPNSESSPKRPDSPVAMETETTPASPAASAYVVKNEETSPEKPQEPSDPSKGLVLDVNSVFEDKEPPSQTTAEPSTASSVMSDRAAKYSCPSADTTNNPVPLASNDSDDDISDDDDDSPQDKPAASCDSIPLQVEPFSDIGAATPKSPSPGSDTSGTSSSRGDAAAGNPGHAPIDSINNPSKGEIPTDNGPVESEDSYLQSVNKKTKLGDSRSPLSERNESPAVANGPG